MNAKNCEHKALPFFTQVSLPEAQLLPLVGKSCLEGKIFSFWRAFLKRRFEDSTLLEMEPFWSLERQGPFSLGRQAA